MLVCSRKCYRFMGICIAKSYVSLLLRHCQRCFLNLQLSTIILKICRIEVCIWNLSDIFLVNAKAQLKSNEMMCLIIYLDSSYFFSKTISENRLESVSFICLTLVLSISQALRLFLSMVMAANQRFQDVKSKIAKMLVYSLQMVHRVPMKIMKSVIID